MNYKIIDMQKITDHITSFCGAISVNDVVQNSSVGKLRVYPALFGLEQNGLLEVVEREELGAPLMVRRRRDASQV